MGVLDLIVNHGCSSVMSICGVGIEIIRAEVKSLAIMKDRQTLKLFLARIKDTGNHGSDKSCFILMESWIQMWLWSRCRWSRDTCQPRSCNTVRSMAEHCRIRFVLQEPWLKAQLAADLGKAVAYARCRIALSVIHTRWLVAAACTG